MLVSEVNPYFIGAYYGMRYARSRSDDKAEKKELQLPEEILQVRKGLPEDKFDSLSISVEGRSKMLQRNGGWEELQQTVWKGNMAYAGDDLFALREKDRWLVFSEYLYNKGVFDDMSEEEVKALEYLLQEITDGVDSISKSGLTPDGFGGLTPYGCWGLDLYVSKDRGGKGLTPCESCMELESSTAALKHFSESFLQGSVKKEFDSLIEKYYSNCSKSISEADYSPRSSNQAERIYSLYQPEEKHREKFANNVADLFRQMNLDNQETVLNHAKDNFEEFAIKETMGEAVKAYVLNHMQQLLHHMSNYWTHLLSLTDARRILPNPQSG